MMEETKVGSFPGDREKMGLLGSGAGVMSPAEGCVHEAERGKLLCPNHNYHAMK